MLVLVLIEMGDMVLREEAGELDGRFVDLLCFTCHGIFFGLFTVSLDSVLSCECIHRI